MVLLIDDEPLVRHSVKLLLEKLDWRVSACSGFEDALGVVKEDLDEIAIVVCDIRLEWYRWFLGSRGFTTSRFKGSGSVYYWFC